MPKKHAMAHAIGSDSQCATQQISSNDEDSDGGKVETALEPHHRTPEESPDDDWEPAEPVDVRPQDPEWQSSAGMRSPGRVEGSCAGDQEGQEERRAMRQSMETSTNVMVDLMHEVTQLVEAIRPRAPVAEPVWSGASTVAPGGPHGQGQTARPHRPEDQGIKETPPQKRQKTQPYTPHTYNSKEAA
ncbi:UNVERIFIED_CONTAM: hypothetical protein K2H54_039468 [Gekko kuhli]